MTTTEKKSLPNNLMKAGELNDKSYEFSQFNVADNRVKAYVHSTSSNDDRNKNLNILTGPMVASYGFSDFQGSLSVTVKFKTNIEGEQTSADNFRDFCSSLHGNLKEYFSENASKVLPKKDHAKLAKNPKLIQAYMNPIIKKDKNGEEEVKLKVRTDTKTKKILIPSITVEKYKYETKDGEKVKTIIEKNKVDLSKCEDQTSVLKEHIKPGSHVQAVISPSIYWVGNKFGITFNVQALMVLKASTTTVDNEAINLSPSSIGFSAPQKRKDGVGYSALVLNNDTGGLSGKILTASFKLPYGVSEYENNGVLDQSIVIMNQTDDDESSEANTKFFEYSEGLNESALDYAEEHKDTIFKKPDDDDLSRDIIESAYFNPCVTQNKNGDDQIKFKIIKDDDGIPQFSCYEYDDFADDESKKEVVWSDMDNVTTDIKDIIRGGSHVRAIVQPRIYFISNKIGINYRLMELHILKKSYIRQDFNNVFSFSDDKDIEKSNTNDSEVTIEEEEEEVVVEEEEEVDSDAYGDDSEEEEIQEASA